MLYWLSLLQCQLLQLDLNMALVIHLTFSLTRTQFSLTIFNILQQFFFNKWNDNHKIISDENHNFFFISQ